MPDPMMIAETTATAGQMSLLFCIIHLPSFLWLVVAAVLVLVTSSASPGRLPCFQSETSARFGTTR